MILLGSIERAQLQALLSQQLGRARRMEYIRENAMAFKKCMSDPESPPPPPPVEDTNSQQRHSTQEVRFQVRPTLCSGIS